MEKSNASPNADGCVHFTSTLTHTMPTELLPAAAPPNPAPTIAEQRRLAEDARIETVIVAVHGIGNQYRFATIQSVAHRVAHYFGPPVGIPLGNFHAAKKAIRGLPFKGQPKLGLAEVYWAHIPREANKDKDTIEETKAWAETLVQRVRAMDLNRRMGLRDEPAKETTVDYEKTSAVVAEMIDFIGTLENLSFLAEKAGLMTFDLRELLDDYLGDVQIVAEFENYRGDILEAFRKTMAGLNATHTNLKHIHIVAHSEGTVVTFRGLLEALSAKGSADYEWIEKVKSVMTIGSPIDKHVVLWPELWNSFTTAPGGWKMPAPIRWWNYYDFGDPVGFELDTTRQWLIHHGWIEAKPGAKEDGSRAPADATVQKFFDFPETQEVGYTRYPLPGKAHNDYWNDHELFDHFLANGMQLGIGDPPKVPVPPPGTPPTIRRWQVVSWVLPYVLATLLLLTGTYLVYKSVGGVIHSKETTSMLARSVVGLTALLAGVTVIARVPRLVPWGKWYLLPALVFAFGAAAYAGCVSEETANKFGWALWAAPGAHSRWVMILVCLAVGVIAARFSKWKPRWGMWPMVLASGAATGLTIARLLWRSAKDFPDENPELWPVLLCVAAFLYLWWLAAQLFDLVFIWHRYIRSNLANDMLKKFDPVLALAKRAAQESNEAKMPRESK